jgi:chromosome segregation ATPase
LRDIVRREFRGGGNETHLPAVRKADRRSEDFVKRTRTKSLQDPRRRKVDDLLRRLKKNESKRTEITGYISQLSIQLHRWQLRLQTLNERKKELAAEIDGIQKVV